MEDHKIKEISPNINKLVNLKQFICSNNRSIIPVEICNWKDSNNKKRVIQQMSRGRLILALKHYFKEGIYYPVDDTNSIYGKEYRKAMDRLKGHTIK